MRVCVPCAFVAAGLLAPATARATAPASLPPALRAGAPQGAFAELPLDASPLPKGAAVDAALADSAPAHLALELVLQNEQELQLLLRAQLDPRSPSFRQWLTPAQFAARFGQGPVYDAAVAWLKSGGFQVSTYPNRLFLTATGTAGAVHRVLGLQLYDAHDRAGFRFRTYAGTPRVPATLLGKVVGLSGLDTRPRYHIRLNLGQGVTAFAPSDLRTYYDAAGLIAAGHGGKSQKLAVLGAAGGPSDLVSAADITDFFANSSGASATFVEDALANPNQDYFPQTDLNTELELDVEMQSVGSPYATSITLVEPPASEIFTTGANEIVNNLSAVVAVSTSIGACEQSEQQAGDTLAFEQAVQQGNSEGQAWFAASGDSGSDDCSTGSPTVDFPASVPEVTAVGGTQVSNPFDANGDVTGYVQEAAWGVNGPGGGGGGGVSSVFPKPSWQGADGMNDTGRDVPDLALMAAPSPGVIAENTGIPGQLQPIGGTSVAAPLAAGFFGLVTELVGNPLGGVNPTLYALGASTPAVFHDVTVGSINIDGIGGPSAGAGYDEATGWGSLDVAALAAAWPGAELLDGGLEGNDAGITDGGAGGSTSSSAGSSTSAGGSSSGSAGGGWGATGSGTSSGLAVSGSGSSGGTGTSSTAAGAGNGTSSGGGRAAGSETPLRDGEPAHGCGTPGSVNLGALLGLGLWARRWSRAPPRSRPAQRL